MSWSRGSLRVVVVETSTVTRVVVLPVLVTFMVKVVGAVAPGAVTTVPDSLTSGTVTEVASTVLVPPWVPRTSTWSPAKMPLKDGELVPGWLRVVVVETSTVTRVVVLPVLVTFMVKVVGAVAPGAVTTVPDSLTSGTVTEVASTVLVPPWVPRTSTWSPAKMPLKDGELVPGSLRVVVVETSTVTRVVVLPVLVTFMVKVVGALAPGAVTTVPTMAVRPEREVRFTPAKRATPTRRSTPAVVARGRAGAGDRTAAERDSYGQACCQPHAEDRTGVSWH